MSTTSDKNQSKSPWSDQRIIDFGEVDRAERHAAAWRRSTFALLALLFLSGSGNVIQSLSRHTRALVYAKDAQGSLAYLGTAGDVQSPSLYGIENSIATWIADLRSIPDHDPNLVQVQANVVFAMLDANSAAANEAIQFYKVDDPVAENQKLRIHRSVSNVQVSQITPLSYLARWRENVYRDGQLTTRDASATVTLAAQPTPPLDPSVARLDPNGILIRNYQGDWVDFTQ